MKKKIISKRHVKHKNLERIDFLNGFSPISAVKLREAFEKSKETNQKSQGGQDE